MGRIESSKPQTAGPLEKKKALEPAKAATTAPVAPPAAKPEVTGSGFDLLRKKLMSVSGRYAAHKPPQSERSDLKEFVSGQRLAQQAGDAAAHLPVPSPADGAVALAFTGIEQNKASAGTGRAGETVAKKLAGLSMEDAGTAIASLSPKELGQLEAAVKAGKVTGKEIVGALLNGKMTGDQVKLLKGIPKGTLDGLKELVRSGKTDMNSTIAVAVGVELAAQTAWGKANPKAVEQLRTAHTDYKIAANLDEGLGSARDGVIRVKKDLLKSPEALASVLAHEGTHLHQGTSCCGGQGASSLAGETEGSVAGAKVWAEIGNKSDPALPANNREQLNGYATAFKSGGAAAVKARVGAAYIKNAEEKIAERKAEAKSDPAAAAARKADDTVAAWEAQAAKFREDLAKK